MLTSSCSEILHIRRDVETLSLRAYYDDNTSSVFLLRKNPPSPEGEGLRDVEDAVPYRPILVDP